MTYEMQLKCAECGEKKRHILTAEYSATVVNLPGTDQERDLVDAIEEWSCQSCGEKRTFVRLSDNYQVAVNKLLPDRMVTK